MADHCRGTGSFLSVGNTQGVSYLKTDPRKACRILKPNHEKLIFPELSSYNNENAVIFSDNPIYSRFLLFHNRKSTPPLLTQNLHCGHSI
jgi:hypothetical protein